MRAKSRSFLALFVFLLISVPAALHLYGAWLGCLIVRARPKTRRSMGGAWRAWWGDVAFRTTCVCLGIRVRIDAPTREALRGRPVVVIANHRHVMDILLLAALMHRLGLPQTRWVLKRQLRHGALFIGHSCIMTECAFVGRQGEDEDLREVARVAEVARQDGASVVLFPEGTRFSPAKRSDGFINVLPPKPGGFLILNGILPDYPILSVTIDWEGREGTTILDGQGLAGKVMHVTCKLKAPEAPLNAAWLRLEWRTMDARLSARP